jgi:hypothetical protein
MKAARKRLGVLPGLVRWAQVGPKPCTRRWGCAATGGRPRGLFCSGQLAGGRERPVSTVIVWNELEHHTFPVVQYTQIGGLRPDLSRWQARRLHSAKERWLRVGTVSSNRSDLMSSTGSPSAEGTSNHRMSSARSTTSKEITTVLTSLWVTLIGCLVVA